LKDAFEAFDFDLTFSVRVVAKDCRSDLCAGRPTAGLEGWLPWMKFGTVSFTGTRDLAVFATLRGTKENAITGLTGTL
jgi:hypothetical protein